MQTITSIRREEISSEMMDKTVTLIDDHFTYLEANEILSKLFAEKISFYKIKNWSSQERFEKDDEVAKVRISELGYEVDKLQELLSEAKRLNKKFVVSAEIRISVVDN
jgi:hypothetical protein